MEFLATEDKVQVSGRSIMREGVRYLSYSGSSITFTFTGKKAEIGLWTDGAKWDATLKGWVAVFLDGKEEPSMRFQLEEPEGIYTIYESSEERTVTIQLMKYSEAAFGKCGISFIRIDTDKLLAPPAKKERRIEIIGDSITCGYGVEADNELATFDTTIENPMKSYSLQTAKALDAEVHLVSWSGIGIISNWVPEDVNEPLDDWLMPMLYEYTDASCSKEVFGEPQEDWEVWDNSRFVPDLILVNLGTNDTSYCRNIPERVEHYRREYERFLGTIRKKNPTSQILCMLGTMEQALCPTISDMVQQFATEHQDEKVHFLHLPLHPQEDGRGADFHPSVLTQRKTAALVAAKAKRIMNWE